MEGGAKGAAKVKEEEEEEEEKKIEREDDVRAYEQILLRENN